MKGFALLGPHNVKVVDIPEPQIGPEDILVRPRAVGICGSDVHAFHGLQPSMVYPCVLGHEIAGEVAGVGKSVPPSTLESGDHVVIDPSIVCNVCYACRSGKPNVCEHLRVLGVNVNGGLAEWVSVHYSQVHKVREDIPFAVAAFAEPLSIGVQAVARGRVTNKDNVAIIGAGPIGLATLMVVKSKGARVVVLDMLKSRLELARDLGADLVLDASACDPAESVLDWSGGHGTSVTIEAVGSEQTLSMAVRITCNGGRVVVLGLAPSAAGIPALPVLKKELDVLGSRMANRQFPAVIAMIEKGEVLASKVISHVIPFKDVEKAFALATKRDPSTMKIVVEIP